MPGIEAVSQKMLICTENEHTSDNVNQRETSLGARAIVSEDFFETEKEIKFRINSTKDHVVDVFALNQYLVMVLSKETHGDVERRETQDVIVSTDGKDWVQSIFAEETGKDSSISAFVPTQPFMQLLAQSDGGEADIYRCDSSGRQFMRVLSRISVNKDGEAEISTVKGVEGVFIANVVESGVSGLISKKKVKRTKITFDGGISWRYLEAPDKDIQGKSYSCGVFEKDREGRCALHLQAMKTQANKHFETGTEMAPGLMVGVGTVGDRVAELDRCDTFISEDGGVTWKAALEGAYMHGITGTGQGIVMVKTGEEISEFKYSSDRGRTWKSGELGYKLKVMGLISGRNVKEDSVVVVGEKTSNKGVLGGSKYVMVKIEVKRWERECEVNKESPGRGDDVEIFQFGGTATATGGCVMGVKTQYLRRKAEADCKITGENKMVFKTEICECIDADFECEYGFLSAGEGKCVAKTSPEPGAKDCRNGEKTYFGSSGYKKRVGNKCKGGKADGKDKSVEYQCEETRSGGDGFGIQSTMEMGAKADANIEHSSKTFLKLKDITPFKNTSHIVVVDKKGKLFHSGDNGKKWEEISIEKELGKEAEMAKIITDPYVKGRGFGMTSSGEILVTEDAGTSWKQKFKLPEKPSVLNVEQVMDFHMDNPDWILFIGSTECPKCYTTAYISFDFGKNWKKIATYVEKCVFGKVEKFKIASKASVICSVWHESKGYQDELQKERKSNYIEMVIIDGERASNKQVLERGSNGHVTGFLVYSKYLIYSSEVDYLNEDNVVARQVELRISTDGKKVVVPELPPNMPPGLRENGYTLLQTNSGGLLLDVEEKVEGKEKENAIVWGTLLASNEEGTAFHVVLEKTNRNMYGDVDVENVSGVDGVIIANRIINTEAAGQIGIAKNLQTVISYDDGYTWQPIMAVSEEEEQKGTKKSNLKMCEGCSIHLRGQAVAGQNGGLYGVNSAPGYWIGVGSVGTYFDKSSEMSMFITTDAGRSWNQLAEGEQLYEWGDYGGILVMTDKTANTLKYTMDMGKTVSEYKFSSERMAIRAIWNGYKSIGSQFLIVGKTETDNSELVHVDFSKMEVEKCSATDFQSLKNPMCYMGEQRSYSVRKPNVVCRANPNPELGDGGLERDSKVPETQVDECRCSRIDFECESGFWLNGNGECELIGQDVDQPANCKPGTKYLGRSGYVRKKGTKCTGGKEYSGKVERICGAAGGIVIHSTKLDTGVESIEYFANSDHAIMITKTHKMLVSKDGGKSWADAEGIGAANVLGVDMDPFFKDSAIVVTDSETAYLTHDLGSNFVKIKLPAKPSIRDWPVLRHHKDRQEVMVYLGRQDGCSLSENMILPHRGRCSTKAYYTTDGGVTWEIIDGDLGRGGCYFVRRRDTFGHLGTRLVCSFVPPTSSSKNFMIEASDSYFKHDRKQLSNSAVDMTYDGSYFVIPESYPITRGLLQLKLSMDGQSTAYAHFPGDKYTLRSAYTVLSTSDFAGSVMLHMTESDRAGMEYGTLYISNSNGTYYKKALEHVNRNKDGYVDFEMIAGMNSTILANIVTNHNSVFGSKKKQLRTVISVDAGSTWRYLNAPKKPLKGKSYGCNVKKNEVCGLNLHGFTQVSDSQNIYSASGAVGLVMGIGNVGAQLGSIEDSSLFLSRDGGFTFNQVSTGPKLFEFADHGAILVICDRLLPINYVEYSLDFGITWNKLMFENERVLTPETLTTEESSTTRKMVLVASVPGLAKTVVMNLDFTGAQPRMCHFDPADEPNNRNKDDFELWTLASNSERGKIAFGHSVGDYYQDNTGCVLGTKTKFFRKIASKKCYVGNEHRQLAKVVEHCPCTKSDFECDYNFEPTYSRLGGGFSCRLVLGKIPKRTYCSANGLNDDGYFYYSSGYRIMPYSACDRANSKSIKMDEPIKLMCPGKAAQVALFWAFMLPLTFFALALLAYLAYTNPDMKLAQLVLVIVEGIKFAMVTVIDSIRHVELFRRQYHALPSEDMEIDDTQDNQTASTANNVFTTVAYVSKLSFSLLYSSTLEFMLFFSNIALPTELNNRFRNYVFSRAPMPTGPISITNINTTSNTNVNMNINTGMTSQSNAEVLFDEFAVSNDNNNNGGGNGSGFGHGKDGSGSDNDEYDGYNIGGVLHNGTPGFVSIDDDDYDKDFLDDFDLDDQGSDSDPHRRG
ncbi:Vacuolar protein sorting/targeting protein 10 [Zancudomyces culisetae]|uniref:Vacuolar protein sorting/targeting protein 10 n=1 Tax=Zancudomyces culisetae TaxID=1213189 RepID=A0A1R1PE98_ZANCU|nr:Vacuolar protein sorting/targeting protein 10 [Zancudomyces culisetae]|eukprot:OMH79249.1 Vacuolar protein sorting/targeting protein 10 [Zancudomyces culisetae]